MEGDKHQIITGCWDNLFCNCPKQFIKRFCDVKTTTVVVLVEAYFLSRIMIRFTSSVFGKFFIFFRYFSVNFVAKIVKTKTCFVNQGK